MLNLRPVADGRTGCKRTGSRLPAVPLSLRGVNEAQTKGKPKMPRVTSDSPRICGSGPHEAAAALPGRTINAHPQPWHVLARCDSTPPLTLREQLDERIAVVWCVFLVC